MGLLDRLGKIAGGFGHALEAPFGLVADLATAPWNDDDDYNGFLHTLVARSGARGGQFLGGVFGPDSGVGAAVGAVPEPIRSPIHHVAAPVGHALETAYREGIGEPISTAVTASSLASSRLWRADQGRSEFTAMFDPDTWRRAHAIAQHRGPGAAVGLAWFTSDVLDPKEVEAATHSDGYKILSGVTDAVTRFRFDPTVLAGRAASAAHTNLVVKPVTASTDFDRVEASSRFGRVVQAMDGMSEAEIRHRFFPSNVHGAVIASTLADAGDAATRAKALRLFMGDATALDALRAERADIAGQVERLTGQQTVLDSLDDGHFAKVNLRRSAATDDTAAGLGVALDSELDRTLAELDALTDHAAVLERRNHAVASITAVPRDRGVLDRTRSSITRSETFQKSTLYAPVRRATSMRPHNIIDLNRPDGDGQIQRLARQIGFAVEDQDRWRGEYMRAWSPATRASVLTRMEDEGIRHLATQAGLTEDEVTAAIRRASEGRGQAGQILKGRVYDGEGRSLIQYKDDDGLTHEVALMVSQTANTLPLTDFEAARRALGPIAEFKQRMGPAAQAPADLIENFYRIWKPSVLLRVGWPIRVVGDEQMRIIAKIGTLAQMRNFTIGVGNVGHNVVEKALAQTEGRAPELRKIGFDKVQKGDVTLPSAFGDVDSPNAYYTLSSSHQVFENAFETTEQQHLRQIRGASQEHRSITPGEPSHAPAWLDALNNQIGRDQLGKQFLQGATVEDGVAWLKTAEGRKYAAQVPERRKDLALWAGKVKEQVDSYTLENPLLREKALGSKVTTDDLFKVAPDPSMRPVVHGPILEEAFGRGFTAKYVQPLVKGAYKALGSVPTDTLSRHPFFDAMYRAEAGRRVDLLHAQRAKMGERLTDADVEEIAQASREYALGQTRHLLYDLQEQSDLAHTLRFLMPFYSAWQETMTRWAGIAVENPAFIARMRLVWNAPEKAGLITDENGNPVAFGDHAGDTKTIWTGTYDRQGQKVMQQVTVGNTHYVTLQVPKSLQKQFKGLRNAGSVRFNKRSANLVLQGAPGFGPAVQVPVNEIVKNRPELADSLKAVLPFGAQQSTLGALLPATVKRLNTRIAGEEDRAFHNAAMRIYFDQLTDYNLGKRAQAPSWAEAQKQTRSFYNIRAVASYISPVAPGFQSPYQPYIDAYHRLRAADPETADMKFLDMYGQEYFALTQSLSKSVDGVPPTVEAFGARGKYKDLIEKHPDLGGLIVGGDGAGDFSYSVYQSQFSSKVAPGSTDTERRNLSFEEASVLPDVRLGWIKYGKAMDLIATVQHERGLPNLRVKGAQDLALLKRAVTAKIAREHPAWFEQFQKQDRGAMQRRVEGLREIAQDKRLAQRPEIRGLADYFAVREQVRKVLQARESKDLTSSSNQDLAVLWETVTTRLAEQNPAFAQTYHRYLDRDQLEVA